MRYRHFILVSYALFGCFFVGKGQISIRQSALDSIKPITGAILREYFDLDNIYVDGKDSFAIMGPVWIKVDYKDFINWKSVGVNTYNMTTQYVNPERNTDYIPEKCLIDYCFRIDAGWQDYEVEEKSTFISGIPAYLKSLTWAEGNMQKTYTRYP